MEGLKIRAVLYFVGFFLLISKHSFESHGLNAFYEIIRIFLGEPNQFLVDVSRSKKFLSSILAWCLIRPCVFTLIFLLFEQFIKRKAFRSNQYILSGLRYLPLFLICIGTFRLVFDTDWKIDCLIKGLCCSLLIALNWRLFSSHWKRAIFYFLGLLFLGFYFWTKNNIGDTNFEQLFSTVMFGFHGVLSVSLVLIESMVDYVLVGPLLITMFTLFTEQWISKNNYLRLRFKFIRYMQTVFPAVLLITGLILVGSQYHIPDAIKSLHNINQNSEEDYFAKNYKNPADVTFQMTNKPKNLILIYVEGLESTYQNPKLFGHNLLASLNEIKQPNISFNKFKQSGGADWTIGGLVSSQCGIPLKIISLFNGNNFGKNVNQFLSGAICLGDVLKSLGYTNIFLNGASLKFSGKGTFLKTHQYEELFGREEWLANGFSMLDMIGWGLPDDLLFQKARVKLHQLMKKDRLFNLTILTVDTHGPDGQLNKSCYAHGARVFEDIVQCTANEVADFINYIELQGWMDRVTIVVTGDHLAKGNAVSNKLNSSASRYVFNMIINQGSLQKNRETIVHVDLFPTILNALGITWSDEHLALGYSGVNVLNNKLSFDDHFKTIEKIVASRSNVYDKLWLQRTT